MPMQGGDTQRCHNWLLYPFRSDTLIHDFVAAGLSEPGGPSIVSCIPTCWRTPSDHARSHLMPKQEREAAARPRASAPDFRAHSCGKVGRPEGFRGAGRLPREQG